jgi:signal transduction histidine kinase
MGLGLPMVKNIVEAYNGEITYNTTLNKGTVFVVSFPKKQ